MIKENIEVVIVGAGVAGLTAAAYLSKQGFKVKVLEKDAVGGGLLGAYVIDGFFFDKGARGIIDSGIIEPMMRQLDLKLELLPNPISIEVEQESIQLRSNDDIKAYAEALKRLYPESAHEVDAIFKDVDVVIKIMDVLYGIENPLFLDQPFKLSYVMRTLLPWMVKFAVSIGKMKHYMDPIKDALRKHTKNEALIHIITQHFFEETPSIFALSYFTLYLQYQYPKGSTQALVDELVRVIEENGNTISHQQEVFHIDVLGQSVSTQTHTYGYQQLLWAGDTKNLYATIDDHLLNDQLMAITSEKRQFLEGKTGADSILGVNFMLDIDPERLRPLISAHAFVTYEKEGLSKLSLNDLKDDQGAFIKDQVRIFDWIKAYLRLNTFEISIPVLRDLSLAPQGKTGLMASTLFDFELTKHIAETCDFNAFKQLMTDEFTKTLSQGKLSFMKDHIIKTMMFTPLTIYNRTNSTQGSATGWSFANHPFPAEYRNLHIAQSVKTPLPNIHQAGQWTFNPAGVPVAILTAKLAADAVEKALRKR